MIANAKNNTTMKKEGAYSLKNCIFMSLNLMFCGIIFQILQFIFNTAINNKIRQNLSLSSTFLIKISNYIGKYDRKCVDLDRKIRKTIYNYKKH